MRIWISLLFCFVWIIGFSSPKQSERSFDEDALEEKRADADFNYSESRENSGSFLGLIISYIINKVISFFDSAGLSWLTPWLFRAGAILAILGVIFFIIRNRYGPLIFSEQQSKKSGAIISVANQKDDYGKLLDQSITDREYKLAIRYLFLKSLQHLDASGQLKITQWKAPYDYIRELPEQNQEAFKSLIDLFESTWYGDYQVDQEIVKNGVKLSNQVLAV